MKRKTGSPTHGSAKRLRSDEADSLRSRTSGGAKRSRPKARPRTRTSSASIISRSSSPLLPAAVAANIPSTPRQTMSPASSPPPSIPAVAAASAAQVESSPYRTPSPENSATITVPADAPDYVVNAISMFSGVESLAVIPRWMNLVEKWVDFERRSRYKTSPPLAAKNRPKVIGDWIARARSATYVGPKVEPDTYMKGFRLWYLAMQPVWRTMPDTTFVEVEGEHDWACLHRSGPNGILSIIAGLYYWDVSLRGLVGESFRVRQLRETLRQDWDFFVDDLIDILTRMSV